jgi:chaperonin GroEL (HSP60 family)
MALRERSDRGLWVTHSVERTTGEDAQRANVTAGQALAEAVRTTLGPSGMDKMLVTDDGTVVVTNDGASILDRMSIEDPTAQMVVDVATTQDDGVGDGTTTAVLLTGELLGEAASLLDDGLHPTTILAGYRTAVSHARERLPEYGVPVDPDDEDMLRDVARTAVTGKWDDVATDQFADLTVEAVRTVAVRDSADLRRLVVTAYPGGTLDESELVDGILVDTDTSSTSIEASDAGLPRRLTDARIALVDHELTVENADAVSRTNVGDPEQLAAFRDYEADVRSEAVRTVVDLDVDVLCCQKSIDDPIRTALARNGVLAVERTRQDELDALARATGATAVPSVDDLGPGAVGFAGRIERRTVGDTAVLTVRDCPNEQQASLLLRGGTRHVAEETKRVVEDCLGVVHLAMRDELALPGGGAVAAALSQDLSTQASGVGGREQLAVEAVADALEAVPRTLAENAGRSPVDALTELRSRHYAGDHAVGVGPTGDLTDMADAGVLEPRSVVDQYLASALEAATMILRVDDVIAAEFTGDGDGHDHEDHDHGGLVHDTDGYPWAIGH